MRFRVGVIFTVGLAWLLTIGAAQAKDKLDLHPEMGPKTIKLSDVATIELPKGYAFINKEETQALERSQGNPVDGKEVGLVAAKGGNFAIYIDFDDSGYVNDKDANELNADEILKAFQDGTEEANQTRREKGFDELHVDGWAEKPAYDKTHHIVTWALNVRTTKGEGINFFTRMLGRRGVLSLNLVCAKKDFDSNRKTVAPLLSNTSYVAGQKYEDYVAGKDKDSGIGLKGLILAGGGIALAAKLGLFAKMGKLIIVILLYAKKLIIVAIAGVAGLFRKKKAPDDAPPSA
jgi:uncharacterized membrane-anchored protein